MTAEKSSKSIAEQLGLGGRPKRRPSRVAHAIQQEIAVLLLRGLNDPRLLQLTITEVEVTPDLRRAIIYYDTPEEGARQTAAGLEKAKGYIRSHLAQQLQLRYMPELVFKKDIGAVNLARIEKLLRENGDQAAGNQEDGEQEDGDQDEPAAE
jgi:ribosome-binding factor A